MQMSVLSSLNLLLISVLAQQASNSSTQAAVSSNCVSYPGELIYCYNFLFLNTLTERNILWFQNEISFHVSTFSSSMSQAKETFQFLCHSQLKVIMADCAWFISLLKCVSIVQSLPKQQDLGAWFWLHKPEQCHGALEACGAFPLLWASCERSYFGLLVFFIGKVEGFFRSRRIKGWYIKKPLPGREVVVIFPAADLVFQRKLRQDA